MNAGKQSSSMSIPTHSSLPVFAASGERRGASLLTEHSPVPLFLRRPCGRRRRRDGVVLGGDLPSILEPLAPAASQAVPCSLRGVPTAGPSCDDRSREYRRNTVRRHLEHVYAPGAAIAACGPHPVRDTCGRSGRVLHPISLLTRCRLQSGHYNVARPSQGAS